MNKTPAIVIFDRDLRLHDNPALYNAAATGKPLLTIYVYNAHSKNLRPFGNSQKWWLHQSLESLGESLAKKGQHLTLISGELQQAIDKLIKSTGADAVFWNQPFEPGQIAIYRDLEHHLQNQAITTSVGAGNLLMEPWGIQPAQSSFFRIFTPFWQKCLKILHPEKPLPVPNWIPGPKIHSENVADWKLLNSKQSPQLKSYWTSGENNAQKALDLFLNTKLTDYSTARNRMDFDGTSGISPHLHWGEISVREIWHQVHQYQQKNTQISVDTYLNEIGFREFSYHLLHHFPQLPSSNFQPKFDNLPWKYDPEGLKCWQQGQTGFPIVDAGMRQLKATGWMHNRARMVVASLLTKGLSIHWKEGEEWFWDNLVDGDLALNAFNWQWVAGSGVDAAPYFRIFNPTLQAKKFDPKGLYQRKWIPELLTPSYPKPIFDHAESRKQALEAYYLLNKKNSEL